MSRLKLFAAAILASVVATPVLAQEVISKCLSGEKLNPMNRL